MEYREKYLTQAEKDERVYTYFKKKLNEGANVTRATYDAMTAFGFRTPQTMYNVRRRVERRRAEAEKRNAEV
jgi:hypothetical protein